MARWTDSICPNWPRALLVATVLSFVSMPTGLQGQARMRRLGSGAELGFDFAGTWSQTADRPSSYERAYRQWFTLPLRGSIIDPLLFAYQLSMNVRLAQENASGLPEGLKSRTFGWNAGAQIMSVLPVSLSLSTTRSRGTTGGGLTSQGEYSSSTFGGSLRYTNRFLPVSLTYSTRSIDNFWQVGPGLVNLTRQQNGSSTRLSASNRKLSLLWQRMAFDNGPEGGAFETTTARLDHRIGWGKGSRLETTLERQTQDFSTHAVRSFWSEGVHIQHTEGTSSDLTFRRTSTSANGEQSSVSRLLGATLASRMRPWLSAGMSGSTRSSTFRGGSESVWSVGPRLSVNSNLPLGFRFAVFGTAGVEKRNRVRSAEGVIDVVNETHRIDETRTFFLERTGVHGETVVIRAEREGFVFIPEVDYTLVQLGDLTQVIVLGSSRIEVGSTVFISYQHTPPPISEQSITTGSYLVTLARKGVELSHNRIIRDGGTDDPTRGLLGYLDETSTTLRFFTPTPLGRFDLRGSRRDRKSTSHSHTSYDVSTSVALPSWAGSDYFVGASYRSTEAGEGRATVSSAFASVSRPGRWISVQGRLEAMDWTLAGGDADRSLGVDINTDIQVGAATLSVRYYYTVRYLPRSVERSRITARLVRRF